MLYLSQLIVDGRNAQARRDLADCHAMHQRILQAFPDVPEVSAAREHFGVLYRVEMVDGGARVLVQSREAPDWTRLPAGYLREQVAGPKRVDAQYARIQVGQELIFRLRANPTKRIDRRNTTQDARWRGKRVELRREEDRMAWLREKGERCGFTVVSARSDAAQTEVRDAEVVVSDGGVVVSDGGVVSDAAVVSDVRTRGTTARVRGRSSERHQLTFGSVVFEGRLRVRDLARFHAALEAGIGSGKAFGFGLLSVAPANG